MYSVPPCALLMQELAWLPSLKMLANFQVFFSLLSVHLFKEISSNMTHSSFFIHVNIFFLLMIEHNIFLLTSIHNISIQYKGISAIGITGPTTVFKNLSYPDLRKHEEANNEGKVTNHNNCYAVDTGIFTGRSPKDKFIVKKDGTVSSENVW